MSDGTRLAATAVVWFSFIVVVGIIAGMMIASSFSIDFLGSVMVFFTLIFLMATVAYSTGAIWRMRGKEDPFQLAKAKRSGRRIDRLVESLDDEEIYDLEALLLARERRRKQIAYRYIIDDKHAKQHTSWNVQH